MSNLRILLAVAACGPFFGSPVGLSAAVFKQGEITQIFREVKTLEASGAHDARLNETISGDQSIKTGPQSRAELRFADQSLTRLGSDTIFSFQQGTRELELKQGTILFQIPKGAGGAKIRTAAITAAITGTTGFYEYSPKAGKNGMIKFGILEGSASLSIQGKLGQVIKVGPGEMIFCTAKPRDFNQTEVVHFDVKKFTSTCPLVEKMGGFTPAGGALVQKQVTEQEKQFVGTKELFATNLMIPGSGTEAYLITPQVQDQRLVVEKNNPPPSGGTSGPSSSGGTPSTSETPTSPAAASGPALGTITNPNPYVINGTTLVSTNPTITTDGVVNRGALYENAAIDGPLTNYLYGSTSPFDQFLEMDQVANFPNGLAAFKFSQLKLSAFPEFLTVSGTLQAAFVSEGAITTSALNTTYSLDQMDLIFFTTVNGSIFIGSEFSLFSTRTNAANPAALRVYARGAGSDLIFDAGVDFVNRELSLVAESNLTVRGQINISGLPDGSSVELVAGNLVSLAPGVVIKAPVVSIQATEVIGGNFAPSYPSGGYAGIDGGKVSLSLITAAVLSQSSLSLGAPLIINSLFVDTRNLNQFQLYSNSSVTISGDIIGGSGNGVTSHVIDFDLQSKVGFFVNGSVSTLGSLRISADSLVAVPGVSVSAPNVEIKLANIGGVNLESFAGDVVSFSGLQILPQGQGTHIILSAPNIAMPTGFNLGIGTSVAIGMTRPTYEPGGNFLGFTADRVEAPQSLVGDNLILGGDAQITGGLSGNLLAVGSVTASGDVSGQTIRWAGGFDLNPTFAPTGDAVASPSVINAPRVLAVGGGVLFNGANESLSVGPNGFGAYAENGHLLSLNLTTGSSLQIGGTSGFSGSLITTATFNGGDAQSTSDKVGGNGGTFNANVDGDITVLSPISATTGANSLALPYGGQGGTVNLSSATGSVVVNGSIDVSSAQTGRRSVSGGSVKLQSGKVAGVAIAVGNSGSLRALLDASAPGPGGKVELVSAGGEINVGGLIQADRGLVDIRNNGVAGVINLQDGHSLRADVVKVGALGNNGVLNVGAGNITADTQLKLYAGGTNGTVNFVNNANLSGAGAKVIAGKTINVQLGKTVTISGGAAVFHTDNPHYTGAGVTGLTSFGSVSGPATTQSHASRPAF
jgi:hypothetical protein